MNRKDRRKQDRMMKKLGIKDRQLVGIGVWYKADQPEGLGIGASINDEEFELIKTLSYYADKKVVELKEYYDNNPEEVETFLDETTVKVEEVIKEMKGWTKETQPTKEVMIDRHFKFIASVKSLVSFGRLEQDEYNGDLYNWIEK